MSDDTIREVHGMQCRENNIGRTGAVARITENESLIVVSHTGGSAGVMLTASEARYLAAKLYRLSRRIRARTETK